MIRPPPLKLKYDNRFPLPIPSARKPKAKESFFQVLYKANWRNIVMAVAGLNAIRFAFATYNAYEDALVDDFEHQPRLVTVSLALCVMYALCCVIEIFGVIGISLQRLSIVRAYVFFEFGAALMVTVAGVLKAASFFLNAEDLMYECVALALTGQSSAKSQFVSVLLYSSKGLFDTFDHASIRRGYQVYREVCAACHSLDRIAWRNLVGVSHTVDEARTMAEEVEYTDGPNAEGEMFQRPGKLADYMPAPYPNEEAARSSNGGALPPDLSLIVKARHGGAGMNYNPYFPGGAISMARVLFDGLVEYDDGTPATTAQMAKDVVQFLSWAAEPEHDERKKTGIKAVIIFSTLFALSVYVKRFKWGVIKNRKIVYNPPVDKTH
ncbi:hypothetical protein H1R20_g13465, partial [Candolleomyces eurysporus]